jgi:hypothetical protein
MPLVELEPSDEPLLSERVALVLAQLEPIRSRVALVDSYRRESLCRLATPVNAAGSAAEVLELAYALRWLGLESDRTVDESADCQEVATVDD